MKTRLSGSQRRGTGMVASLLVSVVGEGRHRSLVRPGQGPASLGTGCDLESGGPGVEGRASLAWVTSKEEGREEMGSREAGSSGL